MALNISGIHTISSAVGPGTFLFPEGIDSDIFPILAGSRDESTQWNIIPAGSPGSNLYTIRQGTTNEDFLFIEPDNNGLWWTADTSESPTTFSIESAGNNQFRFHIPGVDSVWTLPDSSGDQVTVTGDEGLASQRWILDALD